MKSRPILFSTEMVEAILHNRKFMTRRPLDAGFDADSMEFVEVVDHFSNTKKGYNVTGIFSSELGTQAYFKSPSDSKLTGLFGCKCPYGVIGDELYVREKWRISDWDFEDNTFTVEFVDGEKRVCQLRGFDVHSFSPEWLMNHLISLSKKGVYEFLAKSDNCSFKKTGKPIPWRPSIYMPKEATRFTLEITNVRVERLHDISETDAVAEGIEIIDTWPDGRPVYKYYSKHPGNNGGWLDPTTSFMSLWGSIHGTPTGNPWVWVIEFKRKEVDGG